MNEQTNRDSSGGVIGRRRALTWPLLLVAALILAVVSAGSALAAPGDLDPTFDTDGKVTTDLGSSNEDARSMAIQSNGKIVTTGRSNNGSTGYNFALARHNADGSLDTSFDTDGKVTTAFSSNDLAYSVAIQPDGKIVAAGSAWADGSTEDFALARYNADGSLDTSFGSGGKVTTAFASSRDIAYSVAVQSDGKIVAAGQSINGLTYDFALARYNADGSLDTSFDTDGKVTTAFGSGDDAASSVDIQSDGRIVATGSSYNGSDFDFALARYNASDGSLDTSFGSGGRVTTAIGASGDFGSSMAIQGDKIVAAGASDNGSTGRDFALVRYNTSDGSLDTSFDTDGKTTTDFASGSFDGANNVAIQSDGKIVAAGFSDNGSTGRGFALARYNASDGSLDTSFGSGGKTTTDFSPSNDSANSVAIQSDGKIVAAGTSNSSNSDFALARYKAAPQCSDTIDNDSDGKTDFGTGGDPDCESATDDNETAAPTLSIDDVTLDEGNFGTTNATFTVTRSGDTGTASTADFATGNGTATTADNDYEENSGTLSFAANDTQATITVVINGDAKDEGGEAFFVNLSNPSNATISDNQGTGTITDDDAPDTNITSGPNGATNTDSATFEFSSTDSGSTFRCKLDGAAFNACSSPESYTGLADGSHTFQVRARDAAGNLDATPASRTFTVDTVSPRVTLTSPANNATGVSPAANVTATFSEAMQAATIDTANVKIKKRGTSTFLSATVAYNAISKKATLNPNANLQAGATYIVSVSTGARDVADNRLDQDPSITGLQPKTFSFKVRA